MATTTLLQVQQVAIAVSETVITPGPDLEFGYSLATMVAVLTFVFQLLGVIR